MRSFDSFESTDLLKRKIIIKLPQATISRYEQKRNLINSSRLSSLIVSTRVKRTAQKDDNRLEFLHSNSPISSDFRTSTLRPLWWRLTAFKLNKEVQKAQNLAIFTRKASLNWRNVLTSGAVTKQYIQMASWEILQFLRPWGIGSGKFF